MQIKMGHKFQSGKYPGKTVEQVACTDYCHLKDILQHRKGSTDPLTKNIEDVVEKLNNFIPQVKCKDYSGCDKTAEYLPIELKISKEPNPYSNKYYVDKVNISLDDVRCGEHNRNLKNKNATAYEIKFDTLDNFSRESEWVRQDVQGVLLECAGFKGRKTEKNCDDFIYNLKQKPKIQPQIQTPKPQPVQTPAPKTPDTEQLDLF